ncbi:MAG: hypothetical protein LLG00_09880 [Planctomycetaceae bacterium]|nr:hypothetical protein [Planctomycetaceae bacterium]
MLWKLSLSVAVAAALCGAGGASVGAEPGGRPAAVAQSPADVSAKESQEAGVPKKLEPAANATAISKSAVPTPAKRKPAGTVNGTGEKSGVVTSPVVESPAAELTIPAEAAKPAATSKSKLSGPLRPTAEPQEGPAVSVEPASFKGVTPGATTAEEVEQIWGKPKDTTRAKGVLVQLYSVAPFKRVEVSYTDGKVASVVIRFDRSFPTEAVANQLQLTAIRPVPVSNDVGELLGLAYPERGVLFTFEPSTAPGQSTMKVAQVVLEAVTAEPFVLRAETTLESRPDLSRRDIDQALKLDPEAARAFWVLGRLLGATYRLDQAVAAAQKAVSAEPGNPQYRVTYAQLLAQSGRLSEAVTEARKAIQSSDRRPEVKARAVCLSADLLASGGQPDFRKALELHSQAIQLAEPLTSDAQVAVRTAAKEVLVDAHLGAAHDIAWGQWKDKPKAVAVWLERAATATEDLIASEGGNPELLFRANARSLAAYVGLDGELDPQAAAEAVLASGEGLIAVAADSDRKARLEYELGMALYDAVQVYQARKDDEAAMKYGADAAKHLARANEAKPSPATTLLLGRLYFRLGAIYAVNRHDHKSAIPWFDKAAPLLLRPTSDDLVGNPGRHGESLVTIGVSYWETDQKQKAVALSQKGVAWMEQAVAQGTLSRSALAVPYANLAAMHRKLGANEQADHFQELASRFAEDRVK